MFWAFVFDPYLKLVVAEIIFLDLDFDFISGIALFKLFTDFIKGAFDVWHFAIICSSEMRQGSLNALFGFGLNLLFLRRFAILLAVVFIFFVCG